MNIGKIPENVLKRSILKKVKIKRSEVLVGADVGTDCAVLSFKDDELCTVTTSFLSTDEDSLSLSFCGALNNIYASSGIPVAVETGLMLPPEATEEDIRRISLLLQKEAARAGVDITGGHTEVSKAVNEPIVSLHVIGKAAKEQLITSAHAKCGDDIVITKYVALGATELIAKKCQDKLLSKFPQKLVYDAQNFDKLLSIESEAATAVKSGVSAMHDASYGGIFAALWTLAESSGVGLEIDLKKIPVKQETIEICNFYDINPYELLSTGSLVIATPDGNALVKELADKGISSEVVGKVTDTNDRVVFTQDFRRFLEPVKGDELIKVIK